MKNETSINNFFLSDGQTALPKFTHGSLFSGIGGFDLAAEWIGWQNIFHCEWNEFGQKVLNYYWPKAISYADITKTDFTIHRGAIDILTGGFPCQPYSGAGKRLGKEDSRHLWPEMLRAIREIQPTWIVGENVRGLTNWNDGMVFDEVQAEMEAEGYEVTPFLLPACAVNAPHRRDRIWFVAHSSRNGFIGDKESEKGFQYTPGREAFSESNAHDGLRITPDTTSIGLEGRIQKRERFRAQTFGNEKDWRPLSEPTLCNGDDGISERLDGITFSNWRKESIKAGGNAIVPQVAYQIFTAINLHLSGGGKKIINTV
jgi:DNA (cytosine-5)-methyltransferase 1